MQENAFNFSHEKVDFLNGSVQEWVDTADLDGIAQERDEFLLEFITAKSNQFSNQGICLPLDGATDLARKYLLVAFSCIQSYILVVMRQFHCMNHLT